MTSAAEPCDASIWSNTRMRLERKGNKFVILEETKKGKEKEIGTLRAHDFKPLGGVKDFTGRKKEKLEELVGMQRARDIAVSIWCKMVLFGIQADEVLEILEDLANGTKSVDGRSAEKTPEEYDRIFEQVLAQSEEIVARLKLITAARAKAKSRR